MTEYEVAQLFGTAYTRAATMERSINGFRASGIWPCEMVFSEEDFAPARLTEEDAEDESAGVPERLPAAELVPTARCPSRLPAAELVPATCRCPPVPAVSWKPYARLLAVQNERGPDAPSGPQS